MASLNEFTSFIWNYDFFPLLKLAFILIVLGCVISFIVAFIITLCFEVCKVINVFIDVYEDYKSKKGK
jgi:hypothetical protein